MRSVRLFSGVVALFFCTCLPVRLVEAPIESVTVPFMDELRLPKVSLYLGLSAREASYQVLNFFSKRDTLAYCWASPDAFRIRTRPVHEPQGGGREWRTTFFIRVGLLNFRSDCTAVDVRWIVESRDFHDESWAVQLEDPAFDPVLLADLKGLSEAETCR